MIVNELFYSLQGEGRLAGVPSVFIRLAGCPLRCHWCDTKYAWNPDAGQSMTPEQILKQIGRHPTRYVVLTGGEPLVHEGAAEIIAAVSRSGYHVTIETAGIAYWADLPVNLMSISPKLSNALFPTAQNSTLAMPLADPNLIGCLIDAYDYQLKFVVDTPQDLDEIAKFLDKLARVDMYKVYLMPQASRTDEYLEKSRWLADYCIQTGFSFSPRLQVMLWGGQRGK
ncbi:MAG: 7-carboxy-7-deazaguanine synthase QueE [Planctomycetales bacterium]|nr:7-carboxy-7-deazaguanine synthase QueE [Planctomycetales bacterium]